MKAFTVELTISELRNIMQGLEQCLHLCKKNIAVLNPNDQSYKGMKEYFDKKIVELQSQLNNLNSLLN